MAHDPNNKFESASESVDLILGLVQLEWSVTWLVTVELILSGKKVEETREQHGSAPRYPFGRTTSSVQHT
jgi:hypothetical protein